MTPDSGTPVFTGSKEKGQSGLVAHSEKSPSLLPVEADIHLASADGNPNPPAFCRHTRLRLLVGAQGLPIARASLLKERQ